MNNTSFKKKTVELPYSKEYKNLIREKIRILNDVYEYADFKIRLDEKSCFGLESEEDSSDNQQEKQILVKGFIDSVKRIYEPNSSKEIIVEYEVTFIRLIRNKSHSKKSPYYQKTILNLMPSMMQDGSWTNLKELRKFSFNSDSFDFKNLLIFFAENFYETAWKAKRIGWVKTENTYHHIPWTVSEQDKIILSSKVLKPFTYADSDISQRTAFEEMIALLNITDKAITIPLISFTVLSSLRTLIRKQSKIVPEFIISLSGQNLTTNIALANLFCNIYNRSSHFFSLDAKVHANQLTKPEISKRALKHHDSIFIARSYKQSDLKLFLNINNDKEFEAGLLMVTEKPIYHDFVMNLDIEGQTINKDNHLFNVHKNNPYIFSTWYKFFVTEVQQDLVDNTIEFKPLTVKFSKFQKACKKALTERDAEFELNKLEISAWLLAAFILFLRPSFENHWTSAEEAELLMNEAISIFQKYSILIDYEADKNTNSLKPLNRSTAEEKAITFLHTLDKILEPTSLLPYEENSKQKPNQGWIDSKEGKLFLKNEEMFKKVNNTILEDQPLFRGNKNEIYGYLASKNIIKDRTVQGWGYPYKNNIKTLAYDIAKMKETLLANGYQLHFLAQQDQN